MAILTISAQPGLRADEVAREVASRLGFELVTQAHVESLYGSEFAGAAGIPIRGYVDVVTSILARLAAQHPLVFCGPGGEFLFPNLSGVLRVKIVAPPAVRAGLLMVEQGLERPAAVAALRQLEREHTTWVGPRFRRSRARVDLTLDAERWTSSALAEAIAAVARSLGVDQAGVLSPTAERQLQFEVRLRLARLGVPAPGAVSLPARQFAHPSEEIFANLLDFYGIPWEYEPRTFPIVWDEQERVVESFTPDFYLPEFDLYVELTTMKQSLVTKKNRKIKRLRELYPEVNVQVFYQKDFENLIFKYGLEKTAEMLKADG
ncbi:MAG: hypothetical protein HY238_18245 [Acidobacteria bacterium]|nr:hypothetical protein [Acidobacteriota bacterium]